MPSSLHAVNSWVDLNAFNFRPRGHRTMKPEGLASKVLDVMCCQKGCKHSCTCLMTSCGDCCTQGLWGVWRGGGDVASAITGTNVAILSGSKNRSKPDIQFVLPKPDYSCGGYDNEACFASSTTNVEKDLKNDLYHRIEARRLSTISSTTPLIDMKPIQFWTAATCTTTKEGIQPRTSRRATHHLDLPTAFQPRLYEQEPSNDEACTCHGHKANSGCECTSTGSSISPAPLDEEAIRTDTKLGDVHFSVQYDVPSKLLLVKVIEARDLARPAVLDETRQDMAHSNPYVKVCLLPDQKTAFQTMVKRKTQCPVFEETFAFELSYRESQNRTLQLKLKDFDKFSRHCVVGQVLLPLDDVDLIKGRHMWRSLLHCQKEQPDFGDILLSLNYLPSAGRLNIDVIKAKQLLQTDLVGGSVPFVRVNLVLGGKPWKSKKTTYKKNTIDPVFNESVSFKNICPAELEDMSVVVTVWDYNAGIARHDFIGRVVLGRQATGPDEVTHWERMLQAHRSAIAQWHTLRSRQDCDALSPASLVVH